jgi:hypothetical protein
MSLKGNIGLAVADLAAVSVDTVLLDLTTRVAVTGLSIHNTLTADRLVYLYESPDATSASGKRIAAYTVAGAEAVDVNEIIGQGYESTMNIIAVQQTAGAAAGDLNAKLTYLNYTGTS